MLKYDFPPNPWKTWHLAQLYHWKFYWNFVINGQRMNSKKFKIFYVRNKYLTSIICLVSGCAISMLVGDDNPDWWNAKKRNFKILISIVERMLSTLVWQFHMKRAFMLSEWSHRTHNGYSMQQQCCHGSRFKKCQTDVKKLCDSSQLASWDIQY